MLSGLLVGCVLAAACTSGGGEDTTPESADESTEVAPSTDANDGNADSDDTSGAEAGAPTRDGSASAVEPATDVWTVADNQAFAPDAPESLLRDLVVGADGSMVIGGSVVQHRDRITQAAIWASSGDPAADLIRLDLPRLVPEVDSTVATIAQPPDGSAAAVAGVTTVAAGSVGDGPGLRAAVWVERNGEWEPVSSDAFDATTRQWGQDLVAGPSQVLLLGRSVSDDAVTRPAVWSSVDGLAWSRLDVPFDQRPDATLVDGASADGGTVLIGHEPIDGVTRSLVWLSEDGQSWEALDPPSFQGEGSVFVNSVAATPDGGFLAVGSIGDPTETFRPASWTSADGRTWSEPSVAFELNDLGRSQSRGLGADRVVVVGTGYLASSTSDFLQHVWTSDDGIDWLPAGDVLDAAPDGISIAGIGAAADTITVVGESRILERSDDRWRELRLSDDVVPLPDELPWINDLASSGDGFLAVGGIVYTDGVRVGRAWSLSGSGPWQPTDFSIFRPWDIETGPYQQAIATPGGYLAVGSETAELEGRRGRPGTSHVHAFADGEMRRPAMTEPGSARIVADTAALVGDRLVLAGLSFDGTTLEPVVVEGSLHPRTFDRSTFADNDPEDRTAFEPVSIGTPRVADREAWTGLCASPDTMVGVLIEDFSSTTELQFYLRAVDGTWSTSTFEPSLGPDGRSPWLNDCIHGSSGFVAAGGYRSGSGEDAAAALWGSPDGTEWTRLEGPDADDGTTKLSLDDLAVFEDRYLLIGSRRSDGVWAAALWIGAPGEGWLEVPAANEPVGFDPSAVAVAADGTVMVTGWQDGQATIVSAPLEELLSLG